MQWGRYAGPPRISSRAKETRPSRARRPSHSTGEKAARGRYGASPCEAIISLNRQQPSPTAGFFLDLSPCKGAVRALALAHVACQLTHPIHRRLRRRRFVPDVTCYL
jgi:hypothetical protein